MVSCYRWASMSPGIMIVNQWEKLREFDQFGLMKGYFAQKYIERPLVVLRKKFDLRQWVLVHWSGVFFYDHCYCRFSVYPYDLENVEDRLVHLTNTSLQRKSKDFFGDSDIFENMWDSDQLAEFLKFVLGRKNS